MALALSTASTRSHSAERAPSTGRSASTDGLTDVAHRLYALSIDEWGEKRATVLIGRHSSITEALKKVVRFASSDSPVLITGETGTGKELFARAVFLSSRHNRRTFLSINCAQYCGTELIASELFGHRKGSFTGAASEHRGIFEEADGGFVFLDEIGDLPMQAQAMLLRTLSEGEIVPVGASHAKRVNVRVVAATSRDLQPMIDAGKFRADLYYRLRPLHVHVPPVRERGEDWELIARHYLDSLIRRESTVKNFSQEAVEKLQRHDWPGNVREVRSFVDTGFHLSEGPVIDVRDFGEALMSMSREAQIRKIPSPSVGDYCTRMAVGEESFWDVVHRPFMERDLNRAEVKDIVARGLESARGSYKRVLENFGIEQADYLKFMDFLRHHRLKPE